ncbi:hypothetical protein ACQ4N7_00095 [Nodosilinea sp. AN01ver1]
MRIPIFAGGGNYPSGCFCSGSDRYVLALTSSEGGGSAPGPRR